MSADNVFKKIKDEKIKFIDLRFCDTKGVEQHVTYPVSSFKENAFEDGKMFDGSSVAGWKGINESDMILIPDPSTAIVDPFTDAPTLNIRCDILDPIDMQGYIKDPRSIAKRAEIYLASTGIGDEAFFGPEYEFFVFDSVRWSNSMSGSSYQIDSSEASWNSGRKYQEGNAGHRTGVKGGYFAVSPNESLSDLRSEICELLEQVGIQAEIHHHEVGTAGQCEIGTRFNTLVKKADEGLTFKYIVKNAAHNAGLTATFMPKPLIGDNGSGMHVHQSIFKNGENIFSGDHYGGLSETALYYIGGIFKHAKALNAFTNPSTNSYKRLVPGFEAPVVLAYSARNRSASCRIPYVSNPKERRIEIRFPDSTANPYLAFSAMMMAGIDGIKNKIDPGSAGDKDLYDLPPEEEKNLPVVAGDLGEALRSLNADREFLLAGGVFSNEAIDSYISLMQEDVNRFRMATHPLEFELYYSS